MDWTLFIPELSLLFAGAIFLLTACFPAKPRRDYVLAVGLGAVAVVLSATQLSAAGSFFYGVYRVDLFSQVAKALLALGYFLVVVMCQRLDGLTAGRQSEFYLLLSVATFSMMLLVSSVHLLVVYLALELSSYSLYALVFLRRRARWGMGAGLNYFLVGICASAIMLFGLALIYGATGSLDLSALAQLPSGFTATPIATAGLLLALGGILFKLAIFPFHIWAPDAYQGAPNQVAAFISSASKVAAVAILIRVVAAGVGSQALLTHALIALALISMTVGNLSAIAQSDFKRLMAFSSIAQAGYLLLGILCLTAEGYGAALFYAAAVLIMKFTCFLVVIAVAHDGRNLQITELAGLHRRAPLLALALMMALFGLAGIPPTIGFTGKLLIFMAAIEQGYLVLVIIAMVNVVISLYYYLLVLRAAYLDEPAAEPPPLTVTRSTQALALAMILLIVIIGFYPSILVDLMTAAVSGL